MNKAQIQMFETIGILIIFFILLSIGIPIYFQIQNTSNQRELNEQQQLTAFAQTQKLLYLPELDCTFYKTTIETCFEKFKIDALKEILNTDTARVDYYHIFGLSTIKIQMVYPNEETIILYDHKPKKINSAIASQIPILVMNTLDETKTFAYLNMVSYIED